MLAAAPASAGPHSEIASAFDDGDKFDIYFRLDYGFDVRHSAIKREFAGYPGTLPTDPLPVVKDLVFSSTRHTLTPSVEMGVFTDIALTLALPIVISDSRDLKFDQRASPCVFPGGGTPTCIDRTNSTTIQNGLLPSTGFDSNDPTGPGFTDTTDPTIFRGPNRAGLDQIHLGIIWAPMNQQRDDTKPTWKLGAEGRFAIGSPMVFDRSDPGGKTSVGRGVHEVKLWTSMAKRAGWAEPYFVAWWIAPFALKSGSQFEEITPKLGQVRTGPQQRAGTEFGFEAFPWEKPEANQSVSLDFKAKLEGVFEGRAYTDMWEVFQYAGDITGGGPLILDESPTTAGVQAHSYPGVTNVENYMRFAGQFSVNAVLGDKVRFGASFEVLREQTHVITFADAGVDLPLCSATVTSNCEFNSNDVVDPNTEEVNPLHVSVIDLVGHRYRVAEAMDYMFGVYGKILF